MDARSHLGTVRDDNEREFRRAVRHSRSVRLLRWAVPVGFASFVGVLTLLSWFNPLHMLAKLPIDPSKLVISGTKITMEAPRLAGFTRDARPYGSGDR